MTIPVDIILEVNSSQIKHNLRVETSREKFSSSNKLDKVKNHKTRPHIDNESCAQSKLMVQVGILEKNHPSQIKRNPKPTPKQNHPEEKTLPAACLNDTEDESKFNVEVGIISKNPSQMKINPTPTPQQNQLEEKTLPAAYLKTKTNPGLNNEEKLPTKEESESRSLGKSVNNIKQGQECKQLSINLRPGRLKRPG